MPWTCNEATVRWPSPDLRCSPRRWAPPSRSALLVALKVWPAPPWSMPVMWWANMGMTASFCVGAALVYDYRSRSAGTRRGAARGAAAVRRRRPAHGGDAAAGGTGARRPALPVRHASRRRAHPRRRCRGRRPPARRPHRVPARGAAGPRRTRIRRSARSWRSHASGSISDGASSDASMPYTVESIGRRPRPALSRR